MECISLSACSYSGRWAINSQAINRNAIITKLVLPIFAALDVAICLGLTCTIFPLNWLGKEHLSNTVGAIIILVASILHLGGCIRMPEFDFKKPYLRGGVPIEQLILNHQKLGVDFVRQQCQNVAGRDLILLIAQWDMAFAAKCLRERTATAELFKNFIAANKTIPLDKMPLARQLAVQVDKNIDLLSHIIKHIDSVDWVKLLIECGHNTNNSSILDLIKNYKKYGADTVQLIIDRKLTGSFEEALAHWDLNYVSESLIKNSDLQAALLDFIKVNKKIPKIYAETAQSFVLKSDKAWRNEQGNFIVTYAIREYLIDWIPLFVSSGHDLSQITENDIKRLREVGSLVTREISICLANCHRIDHLFRKIFIDYARNPSFADLNWFVDNKLVNINSEHNGETALAAALRTNSQPNFDAVTYLLSNGSDAKTLVRSDSGLLVSSLLIATLSKNVDRARALLEKGAAFVEADKKPLRAFQASYETESINTWDLACLFLKWKNWKLSKKLFVLALFDQAFWHKDVAGMVVDYMLEVAPLEIDNVAPVDSDDD